MVERYANWLIRWRWAVVMLTLVWVVAAAMGGRLLNFSNDYRVFFSADNPQLLAFDALQNDYTKSDNLLFVLTSKEGDLFTPEALSIVEELTDAAWQMPYSSRVDSITNFQNTYAREDDLVVEPLVKHALSLSPEDVIRIKAIAMNEPVLMNRLITAAGHVTGINVTLHLPGKNPQTEAPEVVAFARQLAAQFEKKYPAMEIRLTGDVMMNNAFPEAGTKDVKTLVPLMFVVVILLIGITMKMVTGTLVTMTVIASTIVSALGLTGWVGIPISPPT
ncbi:MAG: MMPL family transporter, partial [Pseudomonadota bacterium]|nr:MMPL family transporter [Pseudomonadota bacterium]